MGSDGEGAGGAAGLAKGGAVIALAGGGTGGHVYPALAMGDALRARGHRLLYLGEAARLEGRVAPERGYPFHAVSARAYPRGGAAAKLGFGLQLGRSVVEARGLLQRLGVQAVLGVGGYIMAPTVLAAASLGLPTLVHESNVVPGLANRLCARVASQVLLAWPATREHLPRGTATEVVGCPVHPRILTGDRAQAAARYGLDPARPTLLVVGGSLGAARINEVSLALARGARDFQLLFICGPRYLDEVRAALGPLPPALCLVGYEDRMQDAYAVADLVLCRAGSSTLAELAALGKPAILVPSPNVTDNHQEGNARGLQELGAAEMIRESELDAEALRARCGALLQDATRLSAMGEAARRQARLDSAERVADLVEARLQETKR